MARYFVVSVKDEGVEGERTVADLLSGVDRDELAFVYRQMIRVGVDPSSIRPPTLERDDQGRPMLVWKIEE